MWTLTRGDAPVVALAIHDGHLLSPEVQRQMALSPEERRREEDPFTAGWTEVAPTRMVAHHSRFEVDLNRPRERAVYVTPEDAWGLQIWRETPSAALVEASLAGYDAFYGALEEVYRDLQRRHGRFLVLDLHSYNHRRDGPEHPPAAEAGNPQVNIGTGTMHNRERWAALIHRFMEGLRAYDFPTGELDVRENVRFRGGHCGRWTHDRFPDACVLSIEVKKFFMDEWTGEPDPVLLHGVGAALAAALPGAIEELWRA